MRITEVTKNGKKQWRLTYVELGKKRRRFFPTPEKAQKAWDARVKEEKRYGTELAQMSEHERKQMMIVWWHVKSLGLTLTRAMELLGGSSNASSVLLSEAVTKCLTAKKSAGLSSRYTEQLQYSLDKLAATFPSARISDLSQEDILEWASSKGVAASTAAARRKHCRVLFAYAERQGWLAKGANPVDKLERMKTVPDEPGILRVKAAAKLMRAVQRRDPGLACWVALSLFCGIRPAEVVKLQTSDVMLDRKLVSVGYSVAKTSLRRLVDIPDNAVEWIKISGAFPRPNNLRRRWDTLRKQVGLLRSWPHDAMRHSAASYHLAMYENAAQTALQMGHTVPILQRHYRALVTREQAREFYAIRPT